MTAFSATELWPETKQTLSRSLAIGALYSLARMLEAVILGQASREPARWDNALVWALTGTLTCLSLTPFVRRSSQPRRQTILALWAALALTRSVGLGIEGALYVPATAPYAPVGILTGILNDLLVAWVAVRLMMPGLPPAVESSVAAHPSRSAWRWAWSVLVVGLAYFVFYFVFGSANALLYTLPFYKNNPQYGLTVPPMGIVFVAQLIRGPLFGLGALFLARTVRVPRRHLALWLGGILFVIGGAAPYMEAVFRTMPLGFNLATLAELLFQNFPTGIVAAYLLGDKQATAAVEKGKAMP